MLMMVMEIYTTGVAIISILTSNSIVFVSNFVIAFTGALASGLSLYTVRRMSRGTDLLNTYGRGARRFGALYFSMRDLAVCRARSRSRVKNHHGGLPV
jgi:hypothetical protein